VRDQADRFVAWIKSVVGNAHAGGIALGLSGGIDSAVLCGLCVEAVGSSNTLAVVMPCYSDRRDAADALMVAEKFRVRHTVAVLDKAFDFMRSRAFHSGGNGAKQRLCEGNLKARLRTAMLYYIANQTGYLVAGSDDRSETYVGYFTKYGDGASDFAPLAILTKTEVRELAKELGVPDDIIRKPSSPGLWYGQTAEGELGVTYSEIDAFLSGQEISPGAREKIELLHKNTEHKRCMPCVPAMEELCDSA
jgi:NAD+ synthase